MFGFILTGIQGLAPNSMSLSMPVEAVVNTGVASFFEFWDSGGGDAMPDSLYLFSV